jgi:hypothetical protein
MQYYNNGYLMQRREQGKKERKKKKERRRKKLSSFLSCTEVIHTVSLEKPTLLNRSSVCAS